MDKRCSTGSRAVVLQDDHSRTLPLWGQQHAYLRGYVVAVGTMGRPSMYAPQHVVARVYYTLTMRARSAIETGAMFPLFQGCTCCSARTMSNIRVSLGFPNESPPSHAEPFCIALCQRGTGSLSGSYCQKLWIGRSGNQGLDGRKEESVSSG